MKPQIERKHGHPIDPNYSTGISTWFGVEYAYASVRYLDDEDNIRTWWKLISVDEYGYEKARQLARIYRDLYMLDPRAKRYVRERYVTTEKRAFARCKHGDQQKTSCPGLVGISVNTQYKDCYGPYRTVIVQLGYGRTKTFSVARYGMYNAIKYASDMRNDELGIRRFSASKIRRVANKAAERLECL